MYATRKGKILGDEELNNMSVLEIEREGVYVVDQWDSYQEFN